MQAFAVTESIALSTNHFFRQYHAVPAPTGQPEMQVDMDKVLVNVYGEVQLVGGELAKLHAQRSPGQPVTEDQLGLLFFGQESLIEWPLCPVFLGRVSTKCMGKGAHTHTEAEPLPQQLQALRQHKPGQQHFRIALVNGLGINLSDTLIGMTAMRRVVKTLAEFLPSFSVDVLLGPAMGPAVSELITMEPWVEQVFFHGPSMQELSRYDAIFDTTDLYSLPGYNEKTPIDWYLWWFGLDAQAVPAAEKRNRINLDQPLLENVTNVMRYGPQAPTSVETAKAAKRVFFATRAAMPLRDFPAAHAACLVTQILEKDPNIYLVIDQPLGINHARVLDMDEHINSPEAFKALIASVDAVIGVDSYALHLADASATPSVHLFSTLPSDWYHYYPYTKGLCIPGAENLPAFMQFRIDANVWQGMEEQYNEAWGQLQADEVLKALQESIDQRMAATNEPLGLTLLEEPLSRPKHEGFPHEVLQPAWAYAQNRMAQLASMVLRPGGAAVVAGAGQPPMSVVLARFLAPQGQLHVFEPRRLRAQALCGDLASASLFNAQVYQLLPVGTVKQASMPDIDPWSQTDATQWGNTLRTVRVAANPIDALQLPFCQAIVIQPPMPAAQVVAGAMETLKRCRPLLLVGPIAQEESGAIVELAQQANYTVWAEPSVPDGNLDTLLLLCLPSEQNTELPGFVRVQLAAPKA